MKSNLSSKKVGFDRLSDQAYSRLYHSIVNGELFHGTRLTEIKLCRALKMGRSPVREALLRLAGDGLVDSIPNAGFFVRQPNMEDIEESYHIRYNLECLAVRFACQKGFSESRLAEMLDKCEAMKVAQKKDDFAGFEVADMEFHQCLVRLAQSSRLESAIRASHLQIFSWRQNMKMSLQNEVNRKTCEEHLRIVDLLRKRDVESIESLLHEHIIKSLSTSIRVFKSNHPTPFPESIGTLV